MGTPKDELRVLVVDDTVVYRRILQKVVDEIPNAAVVGAAANGRIALERLAQLAVDIVLLDVEMPEMNGIEALKEIRRRWPSIGVVLLSGTDRRSADLTVQALDLGALDFVPKADTGDLARNQRQLVGQLTAIFRSFGIRRQLHIAQGRGSLAPNAGARSSANAAVSAAAGSSPRRAHADNSGSVGADTPPAKLGPATVQKSSVSTDVSALRRNDSGLSSAAVSIRPTGVVPEVLLIGCSTGGPQALARILPQLPRDLGVPVLLVQHMPPVFTASLAESLNRVAALRVCEASEGQLVERNVVHIAPGGRHMIVRGERGGEERRIALTDEPPVNSCRPSVDVLFRSAVPLFAGATLSVILTGMGDDGLDGVRALRAQGGHTLTQTEESCVVYGMPRAVDLAGCTDERVPLDNMATRIVRWLRRAPTRRQA